MLKVIKGKDSPAMNLGWMFNEKIDTKTISVYYSSCENVCSLMQLVVQLLFG